MPRFFIRFPKPAVLFTRPGHHVGNPTPALPDKLLLPIRKDLKGIELTLEVISQWLKKKNDFGGNDETFPD